MTTVGTGNHAYDVISDWAKVPEGWNAPMAAVTVDSQDRIYGFNRGEHGVIVFGKDGNYLSDWGETEFAFPHAIYADPDDNIWIVDRDAGQIYKYTTEGKRLMTIGEKGFRSDTGADNSVFSSSGYGEVTHGGGPFNLPAGIAVAANGDIFVADGYANCEVHRFSADGKHLKSWGSPGSGPGEFTLPHGAWVDSKGQVLIADRENNRIQVFSQDGDFISQWPSEMIGPAVVYIDKDDIAYVAEHNGGMFSILTMEGETIERWGGMEFRSCHGVSGDSEGSIYFVQPVEGQQGRKLVKYVRK